MNPTCITLPRVIFSLSNELAFMIVFVLLFLISTLYQMMKKLAIFSLATNYLKMRSIRIFCSRLSNSSMQLNGLINLKPSMKPNPCSPTSFSFVFPLLGQDHSLSNYSLVLFICFFFYLFGQLIFFFFVFL